MDELQKLEYRERNFSFDFFPCIFGNEVAMNWGEHFANYLTNMNPKAVTYNKRFCVLCGSIPIYTVRYFGKTNHRQVLPWETIPGLPEIKSYIEDICKETFTVCAIQYYKDGGVGISPHRDKEMIAGTKIAGLSFGQERELVLSSIYDNRELKVSLSNGSLYVMNPPTNDKWLHSITKDDSLSYRISLTFRNYK